MAIVRTMKHRVITVGKERRLVKNRQGFADVIVDNKQLEARKPEPAARRQPTARSYGVGMYRERVITVPT